MGECVLLRDGGQGCGWGGVDVRAEALGRPAGGGGAAGRQGERGERSARGTDARSRRPPWRWLPSVAVELGSVAAAVNLRSVIGMDPTLER